MNDEEKFDAWDDHRDTMKDRALERAESIRGSTPWESKWKDEDPDPIMKEVDCGQGNFFTTEPEIADYIVECVNRCKDLDLTPILKGEHSRTLCGACGRK